MKSISPKTSVIAGLNCTYSQECKFCCPTLGRDEWWWSQTQARAWQKLPKRISIDCNAMGFSGHFLLLGWRRRGKILTWPECHLVELAKTFFWGNFRFEETWVYWRFDEFSDKRKRLKLANCKLHECVSRLSLSWSMNNRFWRDFFSWGSNGVFFSNLRNDSWASDDCWFRSLYISFTISGLDTYLKWGYM